MAYSVWTPERAATVIWYTIALTAGAFVYATVAGTSGVLTPAEMSALVMVLVPTIALGGFVLGVTLVHRFTRK